MTQRGNRRAPIFFEDGDQQRYLHFLTAECGRRGVDLWAYCLMPNHVHLILTPENSDGLSQAVGETHRRYASLINARGLWSGHLFQGRFSSVAMDESHLINAVLYISLNPVRAGLCRAPQDWPWSSARSHLNGKDSEFLKVAPVLDRVPGLIDRLRAAYAGDEEILAAFDRLRAAEKSGRPVGTKEFIERIESIGRA